MVIGRQKKGDVTISTVILIVLGVAVLVMMIVGFSKGWSFFFDWFDKSPSELQTLAEACALYAQGSLSIDFCNYQVIKSGSQTQLVNCRDQRIMDALRVKEVTVPSSLSCADEGNAKAREACINLAPNKADAKVNTADGQLIDCSTLNPSS